MFEAEPVVFDQPGGRRYYMDGLAIALDGKVALRIKAYQDFAADILKTLDFGIADGDFPRRCRP